MEVVANEIANGLDHHLDLGLGFLLAIGCGSLFIIIFGEYLVDCVPCGQSVVHCIVNGVVVGSIESVVVVAEELHVVVDATQLLV